MSDSPRLYYIVVRRMYVTWSLPHERHVYEFVNKAVEPGDLAEELDAGGDIVSVRRVVDFGADVEAALKSARKDSKMRRG